MPTHSLKSSKGFPLSGEREGGCTRYYFSGNCERKVVGTTTTQYIWIGGDAYTATAVAQKVGAGSWTVYNIFRDHLGTMTHLKNGTNPADEYSFNACSVKLGFCECSETKTVVELIPMSEAGREGRRRNATDWTYTLDANDKALFSDRGFTGHEYLEDFKLYNMNGRLYDPVVGRFLSADPVVQDASFTQSYNRYSYCLNNPLKFTDPDGNTWFSHLTNWTKERFDKLGGWMNENNISININTSYDPVTNRFSSQQMYTQMPSWDVGYTLKEVRSYAGGFDDKAYKGSIWKRVPITSKDNSPYDTGEIRQFEPSIFEIFSTSKIGRSIPGRIIYGVTDDLYVTATSFIFGHNNAFHLNKSGVIGNETVDSGINTLTNLVPLGKFGSFLGIGEKTLNAGQFNSLFKGTGITAAMGGGRNIFLYNNSVRQSLNFSSTWGVITQISFIYEYYYSGN